MAATKGYTVCILCATLVACAVAFLTPQSSFLASMNHGTIQVERAPRRQVCNGAQGLSMKRKGKSAGRTGAGASAVRDVARLQEVMQAQKLAAAGGLPVFEVFVRPKGGIWYPAGNLQGDEKSKTTVDAYINGGILKDLYKSTVEKGVAQSINEGKASLIQSVGTQFPSMKKVRREDMEFGFKIKAPGLEAKLGPESIRVINEDMTLGIFDKVKKNIAGTFKLGGGEAA